MYPCNLWICGKVLRCAHFEKGHVAWLERRLSLLSVFFTSSLIITIICPLNMRVVGAPHDVATSSLYFPCSPLPSGTWRTLDLSISWCCLPSSSSVCLVFFPLSLCLARWFWPDLMNGRHNHTLQGKGQVLWTVREGIRRSCPPRVSQLWLK